MKKITLLLTFLLSVNAQAFLLSSGTYEMSQGDRDLCPQKLKVQKFDEATYLKVTYVGDCYRMGPYQYYCQEGVCAGGGIRIEILGEDLYRWENEG